MQYWMAEHPSIVGFRWSSGESWGSTWFFLVVSIASYLMAALLLHLVLRLAGRRRPVPLGPLPAVHSLSMFVLSAAIFFGTVLSSATEIRETQWFWLNRRSSTLTHPLQWLLCFPAGTRSAGRVFFWSYLFYLSRFLQLLRTFFLIAAGRCNSLARNLLAHSVLVFNAFIWLEFSQSVQVAAILCTTLGSAVVYGCRLWVGMGLPPANFAGSAAAAWRRLLMAGNLACQIAVPALHLCKGGCNGIGAWAFSAGLNAALLLFFSFAGEQGGPEPEL